MASTIQFPFLKSFIFLALSSLVLMSCTKEEDSENQPLQYSKLDYNLYSKVTQHSNNAQIGNVDTLAIDSNIVVELWKDEKLVINKKDTFNYWEANKYAGGRTVISLSDQHDSINIQSTSGMSLQTTVTHYGIIQ